MPSAEVVSIEEIDVRLCDTRAREAAALIIAEVWRKTVRGFHASEEQIDDYLAMTGPNERHFVVTEPCGIIAVAGLRQERDRITLAELAVNQSARNRGYGKALVRRVAEVALQSGKRRLDVFALEPRFFAHMGFKPTASGSAEMRAHPREILVRTNAAHYSKP